MSAQTVVKPYGTQENDWSYVPPVGGLLNTTTAVTCVAATTNKRNYVTSLALFSEALTTATEFAIRDGAGGTVIFRTKIPATGLIYGPGDTTFPTPLKGSPGNLLEIVTLTASGAGAVYANIQGYTA